MSLIGRHFWIAIFSGAVFYWPADSFGIHGEESRRDIKDRFYILQ